MLCVAKLLQTLLNVMNMIFYPIPAGILDTTPSSKAMAGSVSFLVPLPTD